MKNLKRALSLVLATVMVIGMMVVGASAAGYNDFADKGEIVNKDAVSMLTTLKVIEGDGTGNFRPEGTFTREAMAKMISVIMNKGVNNNDLYLGTNSGLLDLDQAGDWAKGHINYCYTVGMIAGDGAGHFFPQAKLTAVAAAKMLLVAIGYNPEIEGLVGEQWDIKTAALAAKLGIFDGYTKSVNAVLSRDDAALLIYNAMDVEMIAGYTNGKYPETFKDGRTILSTMYGVYKIEGVVVANEWAALNETDSDATIKAGKTTLSNVVSYESNTINTTRPEGVELKGQHTFNFTSEAADLGKTVTLFVRKTTILANSEVLGYAVKDDVNDVHTTVANADTLKNYLKGTGLATTGVTETYVNFGYCKNAAAVNAAVAELGGDFNRNGIKVEVIDNNNDGDVDYILYTVETLSEATRISEKAETITVAGMNNGKAMSFDDVVFADEIAQNDLVLFVEFGGRAYVSAPEVMPGKITRVDRDTNKELYVTIGGVEYRQSFIPDVAAAIDVDVDAFDITVARSNPGFTTVNFILDSNGYIVAYTKDEVVSQYALVIGSAWTQNAKEYKGQIEILDANGEEGLYTINWKGSIDSAFGGTRADLEAYLGTRDVVGVPNTLDAAAGTVIKYSVDEDDILTIVEVMHENTVDANGNITAVANGNKFARAVVSGANGKWLTSQLDDKYVAGTGTMSVVNYANGSWNAAPAKDYAIDRNTIAFYYESATKYGVATGWQNMGELPVGTYGMLWPTEAKTGTNTKVPTKLVDVALFDKVPAGAEAKDYLFVLSRNAFTSGTKMELNVVFADGTADTITIPYNSYFDNDSAYKCAYLYSVDADGDYTVTTSTGVKTASSNTVLLKNGTLDIGASVYPVITDKSNVWDVTDMSDASYDAEEGYFTYTAKNAVVIYNDTNSAVVTAWVWDIDETATAPVDPTAPWLTFTDAADNKISGLDRNLNEIAKTGSLHVAYGFYKVRLNVNFIAADNINWADIVINDGASNHSTLTGANTEWGMDYGVTQADLSRGFIKVTVMSSKDNGATVNAVDYVITVTGTQNKV